MIKIENTSVFGWEAAIRGMRNAMNSWAQSDSKWDGYGIADGYSVGDNDLKLMRSLVKAGTDHSKFMRMINVTCDVIAPLYWWKECDTYKVGTVANSCSTMHKIHAKEFALDDFSHEHLDNDEAVWADSDIGMYNALDMLGVMIEVLDYCRAMYIKTKDKKYWCQMIQLLPSSYNQRRTVQLNYQVLRNIYHARRNHKLDEWHTFCEWIETLPYSELITGKDGHDESKHGE